MPAPYGVIPTGFNAPTEAELLAQIEADQRADISRTLDLSDATIIGQNNRIYARRMAEMWTTLKAIHDGGDPDLALDDLLISMAKITGTQQEGASHSQVDVTVTLEKGTELVGGQHFAHPAEHEDSQWTPIESFTAPEDGSFTRRFRAERTGPIDTPIDSITVIATPVVGWSAITASGEVAIGRNMDDNAQLHVRREQGLARSGSSGTEQIRADVLGVENVTSVQVFENYTDHTVGDLPPKSFQVVLWDDASAVDDEVAQAIWDSKPAGIQPIGEASGTALDADGNPQIMRFSRASLVAIYVSCHVIPREGYVGDEAFKLTLSTRLDTAMVTGADVTEWDIAEAAAGLGAKVTSIALGTSPSPASDDDVVIGTREIARFDAGRIVLT